jgi:transposase-like protein
LVFFNRLARDLGIRRNLIYKWREQLNTKQDKAFKRTANNADTPYHKATHSELLNQTHLWFGKKSLYWFRKKLPVKLI